MAKIGIFLTNLSGERFWDLERDLPQQVQIAVNINMLGIEEQKDGSLLAPFLFTVNYTPAIAQISVKGRAKIQGETEELQKILQDHKGQKPPPAQVIQAVSASAIADAILISKTMGIPPPLPPLPTPPATQTPVKADSRYTT